MKRWILHPRKSFRVWRFQRNRVRNSKIKVFASRRTKFPLERCTSENLLTAASFNRRNHKRYLKAAAHGKSNHNAAAQWHLMSAEALEELAGLLREGQTVSDLPVRKRRKAVETLLRVKG